MSRAEISEAHVVRLVAAALKGMESVMDESYSTGELFSAGLTIMARLIEVLRIRGVDDYTLREALMLCLPTKQDFPNVPKTFDKRMN